MQSKKASPKTPKTAQSKAVPQPERAMSAEPASKPRSSSTRKKTSTETTVAKHHHKATTAPVAVSAVAPLVDSTPEQIMTVTAIDHNAIAQLAHSYWVERGYEHGSHEDDWTRAERALSAKA